MRYVHNLKFATRALGQSLPLQYIASFLDLLIVASSTQAQFVVDLFKEPDFVSIFTENLIKKSVVQEVLRASRENERNPAMKALALDVESKIIILLAEMSSSKICDSFLRKLAEADDFIRLHNNIITGLIDEALKAPVIEYSG